MACNTTGVGSGGIETRVSTWEPSLSKEGICSGIWTHNLNHWYQQIAESSLTTPDGNRTHKFTSTKWSALPVELRQLEFVICWDVCVRVSFYYSEGKNMVSNFIWLWVFSLDCENYLFVYSWLYCFWERLGDWWVVSYRGGIKAFNLLAIES